MAANKNKKKRGKDNANQDLGDVLIDSVAPYPNGAPTKVLIRYRIPGTNVIATTGLFRPYDELSIFPRTGVGYYQIGLVVDAIYDSEATAEIDAVTYYKLKDPYTIASLQPAQVEEFRVLAAKDKGLKHETLHVKGNQKAVHTSRTKRHERNL